MSEESCCPSVFKNRLKASFRVAGVREKVIINFIVNLLPSLGLNNGPHTCLDFFCRRLSRPAISELRGTEEFRLARDCSVADQLWLALHAWPGSWVADPTGRVDAGLGSWPSAAPLSSRQSRSFFGLVRHNDLEACAYAFSKKTFLNGTPD